MRRIPRELVAEWHHALTGALRPATEDDQHATLRPPDEAGARDGERDTPTRGALLLDRYRHATDELGAVLAKHDPADPAAGRARSIGAYADFEVAGRALDHAVRTVTLAQSASTVDARPSRRAVDTDWLADGLRRAHLIRRCVPDALPRPHPSTLHAELTIVTHAAATGLVRLDGSAIGDQVADGFGASLTTLLDDDVLGKLIQASAHAIGAVHRSALEITHAALRKTAGFCDDDVKKALADWFAREPSADAPGIVDLAAGVDVTMEAWAACAAWAGGSTSGGCADDLLAIVTGSRDEHLRHVAQAGRAIEVASRVHSTSLATPPTVPFAVFYGGVALVGIAAWLLWAAGSHCRGVADLVG